MNEKDVESYEIRAQDWEKDDYCIPGAVSMTMDETTLKFITGVPDPDGSDWDDYDGMCSVSP